MCILVTGAKGQLGQELQRALTKEDVITADRPDYELTDPKLGDKIASTRRPKTILSARESLA